MPTKVFTVLGGKCPFGENHTIDSPACRQCKHYWRMGTHTFFWCNHPDGMNKSGTSNGQAGSKSGTSMKKRGRPRKNEQKRPYKARKTQKR